MLRVLDACGGSGVRSPDLSVPRIAALGLHSVLTLRTARAWDLLASAGYGGEAEVHIRTCLELDVRSARIAADATDGAAWSYFRTRSGSKDVRGIDAALSFNGFSKLLSQSAHGTFPAAARAVDPQAAVVVVGPKADLNVPHAARLVTLCVLNTGLRALSRAQIEAVAHEVVDDLGTLKDIRAAVDSQARAADTNVTDAELTTALSWLPG